MRVLIASILFAIVAGLIVFGLVIGLNSRPQTLAMMTASVPMAQQILGVMVILIAAIALIMLAVRGETFEKLFSFTLPVLAGALLIQFHWATVVGLTTLGVLLILKEILFGLLQRTGGSAAAERSAAPRTGTGMQP
jgi:hypothetical protein